MPEDFTVTIIDPKRALEWLQILHTKTFNVTSWLPEWSNLPGLDEPQLCYLLDLDLLEPNQRRRLVRTLATRFEQPVEVVEAQLDQHGVAIPARICQVNIKNPHKWLAKE